MKVVSVIGARPQFIKLAPLSRELKKLHQSVLIHTGQHYDYNMNKIFFNELGIPEPDYNLEIGSGTHGYQTGEMLKGIEKILMQEKPDMVMVFGDTNSTLSGALAAAKLHIKLGHVEAGVRNFDKSIPEEINRVTSDYCSDLLFCPTQTAVNNLKLESITKGVYFTGDVMVDELNFNKGMAEGSRILDKLGLTSKNYLLVTVHRAGNTDIPENLKNITNALIELAEMGETLVFPIHPRTEKILKTHCLHNILQNHIKLIEPQGYFDFLNLSTNAKKIITDSGGVQKEAYILKIPCVTLTSSTPWVETVEEGWNILAGTKTENIVNTVMTFKPKKKYSNVFGEGASEKILDIINA